jgi:biopolymer transport protein TolQ
MAATLILPLAISTVSGGMEREIPSLVTQASFVGKAILALLLVLSIVSWAIILQKAREFGRARRLYREAEPFAQTLPSLDQARLGHARLRGTPWGALLATAYAEAMGKNLPGETRATSGGEGNPSDCVERVERALTRTMADERERLEKGILSLATVANVSPFLGLFGTVWGVMNAFLAIGTKGSANIAAVGPGIAEALITTAAGLAAAIPASAAYNNFIGRLRILDANMDVFSAILVDRVRYGERAKNESKRIPVTF